MSCCSIATGAVTRLCQPEAQGNGIRTPAALPPRAITSSHYHSKILYSQTYCIRIAYLTSLLFPPPHLQTSPMASQISLPPKSSIASAASGGAPAAPTSLSNAPTTASCKRGTSQTRLRRTSSRTSTATLPPAPPTPSSPTPSSSFQPAHPRTCQLYGMLWVLNTLSRRRAAHAVLCSPS